MPRARLISDGGRTVSRTLEGAVSQSRFGASGRRGGQVRPVASMSTSLGGADNDLLFRAKEAGSAGNSIRVGYTVPGSVNPTTTVAVSGQDITVTVRTGASNEVQTVTINGAPTGGTFTLTFGGQTTAALARNASAADVQAALQALSSIGAGNVTVTGSAGGPYTVTFVGTLGGTNVAQMTAAHTFTGGTTPGVTVATTTAGGASTGAVATADEVADAIAKHSSARNLVDVSAAPGNDGTGIVAAMALTSLSGGSDVTP
jgi:hypothetical protein